MMAHRTLNPKTAFYGDLRCTRSPGDYPKRTKYNAAQAIWPEVFPGEKWPHFYGSAQYAYGRLKEAGYKFNSRKGIWNK